MTLEVRISYENDEKNWNDSLKKNKLSSVYQITNWAKVYQEHFNSKPVYISVLNSSGSIVGQLTALIHHEYLLRNSNIFSKKISTSLNLGSALYWNYGPIIHDVSNYDTILKEILTNVENVARENDVAIIRGSTTPLDENQNSNIFTSNAYAVKTWQSYIIDLSTNSENYYEKLDKKTRYDIRKLEDLDYKFELATTKQSLIEYTKLSYKVRKTKGEKRREDYEFLDHVWNNLFKKGYLQVALVKNNEKIIGGIWNIIFNNNVIQQGVENLPLTKKSGTFLTWNTINYCRKLAYQTFDMGGANPEPKTEKEKQIDFYKSKWGGKKLYYSIISKKLKPTNLKISSILSNPFKLSQKIRELGSN